MNIQEALNTVRRISSVGRTPQLDIYKHGGGQFIQVPSADLLAVLKRGLAATRAKAAQLHDESKPCDAELQRAERVDALIQWLEAR